MKCLRAFGLSLVLAAMATLQCGAQPSNSPAWQHTLLTALTNGFVGIPIGNIGRTYYTEPAEVGKILETQPTNDVLTFLEELKTSSAPPPGVVQVDTWTKIVRKGLRGTPGTIVSSTVGPEGKPLQSTTNNVYNYIDFWWPPFRVDPFGFFRKIAYGKESDRQSATKTLAEALQIAETNRTFEQLSLGGYPSTLVWGATDKRAEQYKKTQELWLDTIDALLNENGEVEQRRIVLSALITLPTPLDYEPEFPAWYAEKKQLVQK